MGVSRKDIRKLRYLDLDGDYLRIALVTIHQATHLIFVHFTRFVNCDSLKR